jgi:hypothetical protein
MVVAMVAAVLVLIAELVEHRPGGLATGFAAVAILVVGAVVLVSECYHPGQL